MTNANDRRRERTRYDAAADKLMATGQQSTLDALHPRFHPPYVTYRQAARREVLRANYVLELGSGTGMHTPVLASSSAHVIALDVSPQSLAACRRLNPARIHGVCADMAALPFDDDSFDVVASAGSLSYGDPDSVNAEIFRVLRPGGALVVVDSLNHNPAYRLNRWLHYRRGERTKSTLLRMPDLDRIRSLAAPFGASSVEFFGSYLFLHPPLSRLVGPTRAAKATTWLDNRVGPDRYAFKFVLVATDFRPGESGRSAERTAANLPREASG